MPHPFVIIFGKSVRAIARMRGGGSALPGLFVEKIDPSFVRKTLGQLPKGVVVISGTNGKTTTTKMVVALLESQGLNVFTNRTGSNFVRGVAAALLGELSVSGKLKADIAVLELDEAHAVHFVESIKPRHTLLLNVMRDQLDRFGEIDTTAELLSKVAVATTDSLTINREDNRLLAIGESVKNVQVSYYGIHQSLKAVFPNDDELHTESEEANSAPKPDADVTLTAIGDNSATFTVDQTEFATSLRVRGSHNMFNAAGAIALVRNIIPNAPMQELIQTIAKVEPAFGRGESITVGGQTLELLLVKNPAGFRLSLASSGDHKIMIAINDNYADGRDMSWLWDVDFTSLKEVSVLSGSRAYDMALRLQYDEVAVKQIELDLAKALRLFIETHPNEPKRIYCTYTAMLYIRKELAKITTVETIA